MRAQEPLVRTSQLVALIEQAIPNVTQAPSNQTFQALRIFVNDEMAQIEAFLEQAEALLAPSGRLAVISHSLEDYDQALDEKMASAPESPNKLPVKQRIFASRYNNAQASGCERRGVAVRPRARSAKLRVAEKVMTTKVTHVYPKERPHRGLDRRAWGCLALVRFSNQCRLYQRS